MKKNNDSPKIAFLPSVMASYVIIMMAGMLLVYDDYYYNILETKYTYYCTCTVVMLVLVGIYLFLTAQPIKALRAQKGKKMFQILSPADLAVIVWGIAIVLATLFSPVRAEAFSGEKGRYTGCFLLLLYIAAYFCITRYYKVKEWHMAVFLGAGLLMCLFGITDFFDMDLLHFKEEIKESQRYMFSSFIGNINTYTSCVAMVMAFSGVMFAASDTVKKTVGYGICTWIAFIALILGESDNAYLSLAGFFGLLPLYLFRTSRGMKRYLALIAGFFTAAKGIAVVQNIMGDRVIPIHGLFQVIAEYSHLTIIVVGLWCLVLISYMADYYRSKVEASQALSPWFVRGWMLIIAFVVAAVIFAFYQVNSAPDSESYGKLREYLLFGDEWGTHRGYIWRIGLENYKEFPLVQKIFGYGPDTFGIITRAHNMPEMVERYNEIFDSAHNEYLQYLITIGPFGLLAYLAIHIAAVVQVARRRINQPIYIAALFAVLCYGFQAVVNINQPIAAPVMWTFLAISLGRGE
ncbi:MAG: O-antigen ligase family protein [Hungatella sp.]|nr:O-antigen ligase family protein [Hungatella sp.]